MNRNRDKPKRKRCIVKKTSFICLTIQQIKHPSYPAGRKFENPALCGVFNLHRSRQTALPASGGKAINRGYLLYCVCPILTAPARQKSASNTVLLINFFNKAGVAKWANPEGRLIFVYNRLFLSAGGITTRLKKKAPSKLKIKTAQRQTAPVACLGPERCFCLRA